jgi:DNA modification methylase
MRERMVEIWRVLKPTGSMYLHCDWHAAHYLKAMLDEVCGAQHFQNEVIWHYRGGGVSPKRFGRRHDNIFFYTKGKTWIFNVDEIRTPYSQESLDRLKYTARSFRKTPAGEGKVYDNYEANPLGKHPDDVLDIQPTMPSSKERVGYPTQKPEKLLSVFIKASSNPGEIVLDPFAGCGTALTVAQKLKRQWVGIDISPTACDVMARQMARIGADIQIVGAPKTIDDLKRLKAGEFQNWVINRITGVQSNRMSGDMGIDGWTYLLHDPVQVKQSESVGRNVIDNFETAIARAKKKRGFVVAFSFTRGCYEEVARIKSEKLEIHLVKVEDLLARAEELYRIGLNPARKVEFEKLPKFDTTRRSVDELIASDRA